MLTAQGKFKAAAIQMVSVPSLTENLQQIERQLKAAVGQGAAVVVLSECFAVYGVVAGMVLSVADHADYIIKKCSGWAEKYQLVMIAGTVPLLTRACSELVPNGLVRSACMIFSSKGYLLARYDKMHLFDAAVGESNQTYQESRLYEAGQAPVIVDTEVGRIGLAVCYDLRFPKLFRVFSEQAVTMIVLPSSFTGTTGEAHWEVLLRARAIENQCYVLAAN